MRVVSLVPSWTETLIEAGVEIVGRTRFCVHPGAAVHSVPVVGGTKNLNRDRLMQLNADFVVVDREENTREMAANIQTPLLVTHVCSLEDAARETQTLADALRNKGLERQAQRWRRVIETPDLSPRELSSLPGVLSWWTPPLSLKTKFVYMIWREPWMAAGRATFISAVFRKLGFVDQWSTEERYPHLTLEQIAEEQPVLLFSSEPYPFARYRDELQRLGFSAALVDGEKFSWFGVRALRFLEENLGLVEF
jgi:ABC-type Fe3+-hydroxamate transport system substrate-binding protein